jgi:hypothetical protein
MIDVLVVNADAGINLLAWRDLRGQHPHLRPMEVFSERNPFTREARTVPTPDSAEIWVDAICIGQLYWDNARLLCPLEFPAHESALRLIVTEIAQRLGASVSIVDDDDLNIQARD